MLYAMGINYTKKRKFNFKSLLAMPYAMGINTRQLGN